VQNWLVMSSMTTTNTFDPVAQTLARVGPAMSTGPGHGFANKINNNGQAESGTGQKEARPSSMGASSPRRVLLVPAGPALSRTRSCGKVFLVKVKKQNRRRRVRRAIKVVGSVM